jgi:hypothetical protein
VFLAFIGCSIRTTANGTGYNFGCALRIFMFPETKDSPPKFAQVSICVAIAGDVPEKFRTPPPGVRRWPGAVTRADMPKAPVDENGDFLTAEQDVRSATTTGQAAVHAESQTDRMKCRTDRTLLGSVASGRCLHTAPYSL